MIASQNPKISICIPAYNQTFYLEKLLASIKKQTFTDYEVIISDDSTNPDAKLLANSYGFGDKLKYFRNPVPLGSPANWNAAIEKATGQYIKIIHHDDAFATEDALGEMLSYIEANNYDYIFCDTRIVNVKDEGKGRIHTIRKLRRTIQKPWLLFFGNSIGAPSTLLFKKEAFHHLQYDTGYIWLVDIEYYARLFQLSANGSNISKPLVVTHEAMEQRLTSVILANFELQIKEHILLYNYLSPKANRVTRFFMQVNLARLFLRAKTKNKELLKKFDRSPAYMQLYFSTLRFKPFYAGYYLLTRSLDLARKILFY
jgi:glycosyltransferase involved in cell wall biosynthesis